MRTTDNNQVVIFLCQLLIEFNNTFENTFLKDKTLNISLFFGTFPFIQISPQRIMLLLQWSNEKTYESWVADSTDNFSNEWKDQWGQGVINFNYCFCWMWTRAPQVKLGITSMLMVGPHNKTTRQSRDTLGTPLRQSTSGISQEGLGYLGYFHFYLPYLPWVSVCYLLELLWGRM